MKWTKITIKTTTQAEDIIICALYDIGLEGALIEDNIPLTPLEKERMFIDIVPETEPDCGIAYLSFYREIPENSGSVYEEELKNLVFNIEQELEALRPYCDIGEGSITLSETLDLDWINNWKQYFHRFYIDDLAIVPSWEALIEQDRGHPVLRIDPGTAFGTGLHETTQLCIRALRKCLVPGDRLLDIGCGSGILSIIGVMFGAKFALGTDIDSCALSACENNKAMNKIKDEEFIIKIGNVITDDGFLLEVCKDEYNIITANLLAEILIDLAPIASRLLAPRGTFIASGILEEKTSLVEAAFIDAGFKTIGINYQGEWSAIMAGKL